MKFKKILCAAAALGLVFAASATVTAEKDEISVMVDNQEVEFDQQPVIVDGRTLVPIRAVFEKSGAKVDWDQETLTAIIKKDEITVKINPNKDILFKNGKAIGLDVPAQIINDRVLIPVRAISDALDYGVTWNGYLSTVLIATDNKPYRAFVGVKRGFRDISAIADFYIGGSCVNAEADLNGDGVKESINFKQTLDVDAETDSLLVIDGKDFSDTLRGEFSSLNAIAVVSINGVDKQLMIIENGGVQIAHFYTYKDGELVPYGGNSKITFKNRLFFDEQKYVLSDLHGMCFTDIMITGSYYQLGEDGFSYYRLSNVEKIIPRVLSHTYNDKMRYRKIDVEEYVEGTYKHEQSFEVVSSEDLEEFTLLDMYVDEMQPDYIEFYVELPDGTKAVLMPYVS